MDFIEISSDIIGNRNNPRYYYIADILIDNFYKIKPHQTHYFLYLYEDLELLTRYIEYGILIKVGENFYYCTEDKKFNNTFAINITEFTDNELETVLRNPEEYILEYEPRLKYIKRENILISQEDHYSLNNIFSDIKDVEHRDISVFLSLLLYDNFDEYLENYIENYSFNPEELEMEADDYYNYLSPLYIKASYKIFSYQNIEIDIDRTLLGKAYIYYIKNIRSSPDLVYSFYYLEVLKHFNRIVFNQNYEFIFPHQVKELLDNRFITMTKLPNLKDLKKFNDTRYNIFNGLTKKQIHDNILDLYSGVDVFTVGLYYLIKDMITIEELITILEIIPHPSIDNILQYYCDYYCFIKEIYATTIGIWMFDEELLKNQPIEKFKESLQNIDKEGSDKKIIEKYGILLNYVSPFDLRRKYYEFSSEKEKIFVPIKDRKCSNKEDFESYLFDPPEGPTEFIFSIGTINEYKCYTFDFTMDLMKNKNVLFYDIQGQSYIELEEKYIDDLILFVKYSNYPKKEEFVDIIETARERKNNIWIEYFNLLDEKEKTLLKDFLLEMFRIGMIIRRWDPINDTEYPMKEEGTMHGDRGICENTMSVILTEEYNSFRVNILMNLTDNLKDLINSLICMTKHGNVVEPEDIATNRNVFKLINIVFEKEDIEEVMCQRIGSNAFITTGDYYLKKIFSYSIPNFNINDMETII